MADRTSEFKRKIMMKFAKDSEIFRLIDDSKIDPETPDDLIYTHIFPFIKTDYTIQEAGTWICLKLDYPDIADNEIWKNAELWVTVVCSNGVMKADGGFSRTDLIGDRIIELLQWNQENGCRIELVNEKENPLDKDFYYRRLIFGFFAPNGVRDGVKFNR